MKRRGQGGEKKPIRSISDTESLGEPFYRPDSPRGEYEDSTDRDLLFHERAAGRLASKIKDRRPAVIQEKKKRVPGWLWPVLALVAILLLVFLFLPVILDWSLADRDHHLSEVAGGEELIYGEDVRIVTLPVVDLYAEPDVKGTRLDQVLYNTPVQLLEEGVGEKADMCKVNLLSGETGYLLTRCLGKECRSIEPSLYREKLIVTDLTKRIMSHADRGTLLVEVKRGTVLYVLYDGKDLFRVQLPTGGEGWLSAGGLSVLPVQSSLPVTDAKFFASTALTYDRTRWIPHGKTDEGIDIYGVVQESAAVNGLDLPGDYEALYQMGETISDVITKDGELNEEKLQPGDIFFCERIITYDDDGEPVIDPDQKKLAIWVGEGQFLTESVREFSIIRHDPEVLLENWHVLRVARYFPSSK